MNNDKRMLKGFQSLYNRLAAQKRGTQTAFRLDLSKEIGKSDRQVYYLITGQRSMTLHEWEVIQKLLKRYGVDPNQDIEDMAILRRKAINIEDTDFFDILEERIEEDVRNLWNDEQGKFTYDFEDFVFEVEVSVTDTRRGETIITALEISGGDGYSRWNFDKLINKLFKKTFE